MEVHFEDTTAGINETTNTKKAFLSFSNYEIDDRFKDKISSTLKDNVKGSICELAKLFEPLGYLLEAVNPNGDYLTKANFSIPSTTNKHLIIALNNKGAKDNWVVSSIRIEKSEGENVTKINECIEELFSSAKDFHNGNSILFPTDFRGKIYEKWNTTLSEKGFKLDITETHANQDIFSIGLGEAKAKFRVWYRNDGFISQFIMLEKSDENLGENLKKWLIDGN
jgi:hypothetical protein